MLKGVIKVWSELCGTNSAEGNGLVVGRPFSRFVLEINGGWAAVQNYHICHQALVSEVEEGILLTSYLLSDIRIYKIWYHQMAIIFSFKTKYLGYLQRSSSSWSNSTVLQLPPPSTLRSSTRLDDSAASMVKMRTPPVVSWARGKL